MKKQFHFSSKLRHLKNVSRKLELIEDKSSSVFRKTLHRFFRLLNQLKRVFSFSFLKKFAAGTAFTFFLSSQNADAQIVFAAPVAHPFNIDTVGIGATMPSFADLDNDGDQDMLIASYNGTYITLNYYQNVGADTAANFIHANLPNGLSVFSESYVSTIALADMDNDGDYDLIQGQFAANAPYQANIVIYRNIGTASTPSFAPPLVNPLGIQSLNNSYFALVAAADIDNDGDVDIFSGGYYDLGVFINSGTPTVPAFGLEQDNIFGIPAGQAVAFPAIADLDNDGDKELLFHTYYANNLVYMQDSVYGGLAHFSNAQNSPFSLFADTTQMGLAFVDIDNDGDLDFFYGEYDGGLFFQENLTPHIGVGTHEINANKFAFSVYPNPVADKLIISSSNNFEPNTEIEIRNVLGQIILEEKISSNEKTIQLNVSELAAGSYSVLLKSNTGVVSKSFVKK